MCPRRFTGTDTLRIVVLAATTTLAACAGGRAPPVETARGSRVPAYNRPYQVRGRWYSPHAQPRYDEVGVASWYAYESSSRRTSDGEPFDIRVASAAHTTLPIPSWLEVTNLDNGRRARVRLNDRGPFVQGRLIDLSRGAAVELGFVQQGTARVRVRYLGPAAPLGGTAMWAMAERTPLAPIPARPRRADTPYVLVATAIPLPADPRAEVAADVAAASADLAAADIPPERAATVPPLSPSLEGDAGDGRFEVEVAAFADRGNAERAAQRLSAAGRPRIEPLRRGASVLYRVSVGAWAQAGSAAAAQEQVIAMGFRDARVIAR